VRELKRIDEKVMPSDDSAIEKSGSGGQDQIIQQSETTSIRTGVRGGRGQSSGCVGVKKIRNLRIKEGYKTGGEDTKKMKKSDQMGRKSSIARLMKKGRRRVRFNIL